VGVFDTAYHQTMPDFAFMYGLPYEYYQQHHIRYEAAGRAWHVTTAGREGGCSIGPCTVAVQHLQIVLVVAAGNLGA
jgi:acetate kinase